MVLCDGEGALREERGPSVFEVFSVGSDVGGEQG
jgi:hypothetical protein